VFSWNGGLSKGPFNIYVQLVGTSSPLRLTNSSGDDAFPAWSPDGRHIAFLRTTPQEQAYYLVSALGGPERKLGPAYEDPFAQGLTWSPDGKDLVVADHLSRDAAAGLIFISTESGERRDSGIVPPGPLIEFPALSPDGKYFAFVSGPGLFSNDVYVAPAGGGKARAITAVHSWVLGAAWTPDAQELVLESNHTGLRTLWTVGLSGGDPQPVAFTADHAAGPTVALRGNRLAFLRIAEDTNLWKASLLPGQHLPVRIVASTQEENDPSFSPDGKRIAFASDRSGNFEIYVCDADGSNQIQLTSMRSTAGTPRWSPDGRLIAFDSTLRGHSDIFLVSSEGGAVHRLTSGSHDYSTPNWSHDGQSIYFAGAELGKSGVWKVPSQGGTPVPLAQPGGGWPMESADGNFLYYLRDQAVWRFNFRDRSEAHVVDVSTDNGGDVRLCGNDICFADRSAGKLIRFDPVKQAKHDIPLDLGSPSLADIGIDVSADGRWVIFVRPDSSQSDIMLVENFH
jgi:Tol biopolymer transport system component